VTAADLGNNKLIFISLSASCCNQ